MPHLWKIKQPYNVSVAAATAAMASLDDAEWLRSRLRAIVAERERLQSALSSLELLEPVPSNANFVLCRVVGSNARELKLELERTGILVRYFAKPGLEDCIRISVGRPEDTERLISVLAELSRGSGAKEVQ
jgi:histidinol-phosphate aminotransferase